jgi:protein TonB
MRTLPGSIVGTATPGAARAVVGAAARWVAIAAIAAAIVAAPPRLHAQQAKASGSPSGAVVSAPTPDASSDPAAGDSLSFSPSRAQDEVVSTPDEGRGLIRRIMGSRFGASKVADLLFRHSGIMWLLLLFAVATIGVLYRVGTPAITDLPGPAAPVLAGFQTLPIVGEAHPVGSLAMRLSRQAAALAILGHLMVFGAWFVQRSLPHATPPRRMVRFVTVKELAPPPSIGGASPPPVINIAEEVAPPPIGVPEPVPAVQAQAPTIATQQEMSEAIAPVSMSGLGSGSAGDSIVIGTPGPGEVEHSPTPDEFVSVEEEPVRLKIDPPVYPDVAKAASVEGTVLVRALVGKDGKVKDCIVIEGSPMLTEAAVACAKTAVFKPALAQHKAVEVWVMMPITFQLR